MSHAKPAKQGSNAVVIILIVLGALFAIALVCGGLIFFMAFATLAPAVTAARGAAQRMESMNRLKMVGLALHNYHDVYNSFPAAYVENEDGNPRYSWRTALLPFVERAALFDSYDSNRSWDSPKNQSVVSQRVEAFQSLRDTNIAGNGTSFVALGGPGTIFDGNKFTRLRDIVDGTVNTIIVVEVIGSNIPWAKPQDLNIDDVRMSGQPGDLDPNGFLALFADGSVRFLEGISVQDLKALASRGGGEVAPMLD